VITLDRRPIGMIQTYRLSDNPDYETAVGVEHAAGVDLLIGAPDLVGIGLGTEILQRFVARIGWRTYPEVRRYMAGPSIDNARSCRAFEKAGFSYLHTVEVPGEPEPECVMVLERPLAP
jgi:aminoglycoside 6'-N-acetyltransferase